MAKIKANPQKNTENLVAIRIASESQNSKITKLTITLNDIPTIIKTQAITQISYSGVGTKTPTSFPVSTMLQ